jgi:hypothetical protein
MKNTCLSEAELDVKHLDTQGYSTSSVTVQAAQEVVLKVISRLFADPLPAHDSVNLANNSIGLGMLENW